MIPKNSGNLVEEVSDNPKILEKKQREIIKQISREFFHAVKANNSNYLHSFKEGYFKQSLSFRQNFFFNMVDKAGFGIEHYTAWNNNVELFFFLIKIRNSSLNFNRCNGEGITPLMMASLGGKGEMVEILVSVVDVN